MSKKQKFKLVVTGGGTGGHLFPGVAVAQEFKRRFPTASILFIGTGRQVDKNNLGQYPFGYKKIHCSGLKGGSLWKKLTSLAKLPIGLIEAIIILLRFKPDLVFGVGGYVTGPVVLGAWLLKIPTCVHEQNSVPGMANIKLGAIVDYVFLSIPGSEKYFKKSKCIMSGNPIRKEILDLLNKNNKSVAGATLLVLGGSLGAHKINTLVPKALALCKKDLPEDFEVIHQTGTADYEDVKHVYGQLGVRAEVKDFFNDMAGIYERASLVLSRAGATTLAELTALSKAAILVPYPYAADDHQTKNGSYLVQAGAAKMYNENSLTAQILAEQIIMMLADNEMCQIMGARAGTLAKVDAVESIVDRCLELTCPQAMGI